MAELRDARWITGSPGTLCHTMVVRTGEASGFTPRIQHYADDFATVLALVAAGQGVSLVPQLGVMGAPSGVTLTPLTSRRRTRVAYRKGTRRHPVVSAFAEAVRAGVRTVEDCFSVRMIGEVSIRSTERSEPTREVKNS